jgi:soluble lytic murein transglycosylase-like protein
MMILGLAAFAIFIFSIGGIVQDNNELIEPYFIKYDDLFYSYAKKYGLDWRWLKAIAMNESDLGRAASVKKGLLNPNDIQGSKSSDGLSWGLMQVTIRTARDLDKSATEVKLNNPAYSVDLAARLLKNLKTQFNPSDPRYMEWVIKSYNQGAGNTKKEIASGKGYADEYWHRFKRNILKINQEQLK